MDKQAPITLIRLVQLSLVMTLIVIMLGAYTRLSDAGLGCPDWPGCYGQLSVPTESHEIEAANSLYPERAVEQGKAWLEMIHRYFAGTLGLLVFACAFWCMRIQGLPKTLPIVIVATVILQAALGMWTVTLKLMPIIVMAHLIGGFTLFCLLALLCCSLRNVQQHIDHLHIDPALRYWAVAGLAVLAGQIFLGGWTSSNYAALMCTALPICEGDWFSYLDFENAFNMLQPGHDNYEFGVLEYPARMTIHVTHRLGAILTSLLLLTLVYKLIQQHSEILNRAGWFITVMLILQIMLGVSNVLYQLPLAVAVLHNLGAALLLVGVVVTNYLLWRPQIKYVDLGINQNRGADYDG
ncbi:heme A synthase [Vibrio sp. T187]|uniref:COX15/CtaA family protein n=1 Tax=Vibrio TaxID=662 RepID=UPI0010C9584D|nr:MULTISPECIES: COX15/CtaA family protein [Vibrio]MBW3695585.1 heme A synthase [Vibrio sp. T187]